MSTKRYSAQKYTHIMRESKPPIKMLLFGKTGCGKSSSGNTILEILTPYDPNKQTFTTASSPASMTAQCETGVAMVGGRTVRVIDTPGFFDTQRDEKVIKSELIKAMTECAPAVDAVVIVLKVERYTKHETEILDKIVEVCGEGVFKHAVVLFTHCEQLEGQTIKEFVKQNQKLQDLVNRCGGRCHVIDNTYWNDCHLGYRSNKVHVKKLMETIDVMVQENGYYTNELMSIVEEDIQEEMKNTHSTNLSPEEKREAAKKIVYKKYLIRFAGAATGTLIGAFMGVGVAVASVVALLRAAKFTKVFKAMATTASTLADKAAMAAAATGAAGVGTASVSAVTAAAAGAAGVGTASVSAAAAAGAAGMVAMEAGMVTGVAGATAAAGTVAVEAGVAAGAGIGAAAGTGIAAGVIFGAAALAGAVGGGVTGYKAAKEADSVLDAIKMSAKVNYENAKAVVKKAEELPSNVYKKFQ